MEKRYQLSREPVEVKLHFTESGTLLSDKEYDKIKNKPKEVIDNKETYKVDDKEFIVYTEYFSFIRPSYKLASKIERASATYTGAFPQIDFVMLSHQRLLYLLKDCSLVKLEFIKDFDGFEYIKNLDDLIGNNGIAPEIISEALGRFVDKLTS